MDIRNDIEVDHEHRILSNYAIYETSIVFRSGKIDSVIKSAMELNSSYILNAPALSLEGGDSLDMTTAHTILHTLKEECNPVKLSLHTIEEIKCPVVGELIKKFDEFYYDKSLNLITNGVHKSTVSKKTLGYGDQCDKKNSVLNIQPNQKDDLEAVSNESPIRNKTNLFLRNENSFSDDKIVLENISSDTFNVYRKFPSSTSSPKVKELIKKFDEFYYDKSLNLITNGVHKSTVSKKTLGYGDQCDKKNSVLNIQPNQKDDLEAVSNESPIRNKTNLFLRNGNHFSDDKIVLENISSDTFNIYRKFPSSTSSPKVRELIKKFDKCFFDKSPSHTASPKVRELIKRFDEFFYDKSQNLITNGVRKSTVMKKTLGHRDQCDKKRPLLNI
ncbi:uncharacterized protein LOC126895407 isoform X1 [Daktulosphaira vitifoliae]|uniref:uncharacterized protein LOC126895407 isoform X1 n=1 Tax=Daktulosphaira vitifoliae TaxID=58002 RepID=UPI0021AAB95C|nr:uncharacterized protein LOC126895407 isoform X1 [Daktulosphaira vitifoliae]XP_050523196.1 uncharacterized protein LOC126895407 isoform X1 [Daktulosphaira vitifoliae]XP_050523197.1 uncharacterized protein LOC126895407 isoform X1 [Daktulosphaira vitifoliae]